MQLRSDGIYLVLVPETASEEAAVTLIRAGLSSTLVTLKAPVPRSPKWPKVRKEWLKDHPECAACGGTNDLEVHHIKPFHLHPELELDPTNFVTLCEHPSHNCHLTWGHFYDWTKYNAAVVQMTTSWAAARKVVTGE